MLTIFTEEEPDFTGCVYYAYQREVCPTTQRKHWQCYAVFANRIRFGSLQRRYPGAHLEVKKGTCKQASEYCSKAETRLEGTEPTIFGDLPAEPHQKGGAATKRNYEEAFALAKERKLEEISKDLLTKHYRTYKSIADDFASKPTTLDGDLTNEWYCGPTGTGKSRKARTDNPGAYIKSLNEWWDNYSGEDTVIIEDVSPFEIKLGTSLKLWADRYPFPCNKKFGGQTIRPKKIIVTSNYTIREIWNDANTYEPLERRFKQISFIDVNL